MGPIEIGKKRIYFFVAAAAGIFLIYNLLFLSGTRSRDGSASLHIPGQKAPLPDGPVLPANEDEMWQLPPLPDPAQSVPAGAPVSPKLDHHPIATLMADADNEWSKYESERSQTFRQTVDKYRNKYGRHPPPGFKEWYIFARERNVWNIDDFDHIMDDLRPFWAIEPIVIRTHAAHMWENPENGVAGIHIRKNKVAKVENGSWRSDTMTELLEKFIQYLPDMDIMMNRLDQPRLVVPWEDLQDLLAKEYKSRVMPPEAEDGFTQNQTRMTNLDASPESPDDAQRFDDGWFGAPGKQYMLLASKACPPESPARANWTVAEADALYKNPLGGLVTNFNLSSDLCTVGPAIQDLHGMLYSASSILASHKLVPIFSECKVNVNNDILFPANMYYRHDDRYDYSDIEDVPWKEKVDTVIWRGVTSGGVQIESNWQTMHRQRLVQLMNGTHMAQIDGHTNVVTVDSQHSIDQTNYKNNGNFRPAAFAEKYSDVGFVESWGCVPNCSFYDSIFSWKPQTTLTAQFRSKYLIDVDGHSFSGRWHAFLQSKSLGLKATIFREWHDSRLFAWRHFVPVDNRYDDLYSLLSYFIGYGTSNTEQAAELADLNPSVFVQSHQNEAMRIARQGREWAHKVLRREDIEVYMFRLLLEYGRIIDDNRDRIGYSGDGTELDRFDAGEEASGTESPGSRWGIGNWFGQAGQASAPTKAATT